MDHSAPDAQYTTSPRQLLRSEHVAGGEWTEDDDHLEPHPGDDPNLVSSLCEDGQHRPALDLDLPVVLVESSTPGHYHLYLPTVALDWGRYERLLDALLDAGVLGAGFVAHSKVRQMTRLRLPGVAKIRGCGDSD